MPGDETQLTQGRQTKDPFEHFKKTEANFQFQFHVQKILRDLTKGMPNIRVLDYGAGAIPYPLTIFSTIQKGQETVAYDPLISEDIYRELDPKVANGIWWTKEPPLGQKFDLAVCHFSLHHMNKPPDEALKELTTYSPTYVAIVDYDFTDSTSEEFKDMFISEQEQKELQTLFGDSWEQCFAFHSHYGLSIYQEALRKNGFSIATTEFGKDIAKHKFLLVGETT